MSRTIAIEWIPVSKYCELTGETADAVDKRIRSGYWLRDIHVRQPEGSSRLWINIEAVNQWAAGKKPAPLRRPTRQAERAA